MALVNKLYTFSTGATIVASEINANYDIIYADYNGNITNANVSPTASIADTKLAQITTAAKVSGTSFIDLASIPVGAGIIPADNLSTAALIPSGVICMWYGTIVSIPIGWLLCNGSNGTIDLRDKFIVGAGSTYAVGATGGAATHVHAGGSLVTQAIQTITTRGAAAPSFAVTRYGIDDNSGGTDWDAWSFNNVTVDGNSDSSSSLPPYYALCYIQKS
jgi:hypothetical protein